jgi:hypothetical protein
MVGRTGLAGFGAAEFGQAFQCQVQRADCVGLLIGRVGREPLAAVRVNSVGKALHDLDGALGVHAANVAKDTREGKAASGASAGRREHAGRVASSRTPDIADHAGGGVLPAPQEA